MSPHLLPIKLEKTTYGVVLMTGHEEIFISCRIPAYQISSELQQTLRINKTLPFSSTPCGDPVSFDQPKTEAPSHSLYMKMTETGWGASFSLQEQTCLCYISVTTKSAQKYACASMWNIHWCCDQPFRRKSLWSSLDLTSLQWGGEARDEQSHLRIIGNADNGID